MRFYIANKDALSQALIWALPLAIMCLTAHGQVPAPPDPLSFTGPKPDRAYRDIRIEQNLGASLPMNLRFRDETGKEVTLQKYFTNRPVVLAMVYYECPMLCGQVMQGMVESFMLMNLDVGRDFDVLCVTVDPNETPELAAAKKAAVLEKYNRQTGAAGWHFLTAVEDGDAEAIETLAGVVGFRYVYDPVSDQYAHAAGIMVVTPEAKVSKYMLGIQYVANNLRYALVEASGGKVGTLVDQLVLLCYHWDASTGQYTFYVIGALRVAALATILPLAGWILLMLWRERKQGGAPPPDVTPAGGPTG